MKHEPSIFTDSEGNLLPPSEEWLEYDKMRDKKLRVHNFFEKLANMVCYLLGYK